MPRVSLRDLLPQSENLTSAALADEHSFGVFRVLVTASPEDRLVLLDFDGIASADTAYLHRSLWPYFASEEQLDDALIGFCPLLLNLNSASLVGDISGYLLGRGRVLVVAAEDGGGLHFQQMLGRLDATLTQPFNDLLRAGTMTARDPFEIEHGSEFDRAEFERTTLLERLVSHRLALCNRKGSRIYRPTVRPPLQRTAGPPQ